MAVILADDNFKCIFLYKNNIIPIPISLKFIPRGPIDNKPTGRQAIIWVNADLIHWRIYASLGGDELTTHFRGWI